MVEHGTKTNTESPDHEPGLTTEPHLYEVREVAETLRISRSKVYLLTNNGDLPSVRIGSRRLVRRGDLEAFVSSLAIAS